MRLLGRIEEQKKAHRFAYFLLQKGIENECEILPASSSDDKLSHPCLIWVYDEDQYEEAKTLFQQHNETPSAPEFEQAYQEFTKTSKESKPVTPPFKSVNPKDILSRKHKISGLTLVILMVCIALYIAQILTAPHIIPPKNLPTNFSYAPLLSPVQKELLYDYPSAYTAMETVFKAYNKEQIADPQNSSEDLQLYLDKIETVPHWQGIYHLVVNYKKNIPTPPSPLFEKISQGEIWRLFTPALLHVDLLHLFFNIIWLLLLGPQMERKLRIGRYLLIIVITAIITNTAQYLMSGPNFMGLSGVICAMVGFIWVRQYKAPWEGYLLQRSTLLFIGFYVLVMLALQIGLFFMELYGPKVDNIIGIANTAHIVGLMCGVIMAQFKFFAWRPKKIN
ncbi:MAG: rhomboid family intramembrane serine protease [Parachlamydiales bacterium]|nr:rhomboid family intramembrane serine protease [Parachlamydiales bacterium]